MARPRIAARAGSANVAAQLVDVRVTAPAAVGTPHGRGCTFETVRTLAVVFAVAFLAACAEDASESQDADSVRIRVSPAAERLARDVGVDLEGLVEASASKVLRLLPRTGRVRIVVERDLRRTIPGLGVGGFADPATGDVSVWIGGRPRSSLREALETWIPATLAHELNNASRIRIGPGYGDTLGEALVTEGLADHFAEEAFPDTPPTPWANALSKEQERAVWRRAEQQLWEPYSHPTWFFGGGDLPQWAGYTLGFGIVAAYLGDGRSAAEAVEIDARTIVRAYAERVKRGEAASRRPGRGRRP